MVDANQKLEEERRLVERYNQIVAKLSQGQNTKEVTAELQQVLNELERLRHS